MDVQWAKIRSWHALRPDDYFGPTAHCGRSLEGREIVDKMPDGGKKCDTCEETVIKIAQFAGVID
jgi:hypothetical protein